MFLEFIRQWTPLSQKHLCSTNNVFHIMFETCLNLCPLQQYSTLGSNSCHRHLLAYVPFPFPLQVMHLMLWCLGCVNSPIPGPQFAKPHISLILWTTVTRGAQGLFCSEVLHGAAQRDLSGEEDERNEHEKQEQEEGRSP